MPDAVRIAKKPETRATGSVPAPGATGGKSMQWQVGIGKRDRLCSRSRRHEPGRTCRG